jgi:small subunit ribosomal protein S8
MVIDPISNLLTSIRNAGAARITKIVVPHSRLKKAALDVIVKAGYAKSVSEKGAVPERVLEVELAYEADGTPKVLGAKRVSKFSCRSYVSVKEIKPVKRGLGLAVLSTPKGVMSGEEATKQNVGGEVLFEIW